MKRYDEYKQTGTPWSGEIPSHWECKRLRFICEFRNGYTPSKANPDFWTDGTIPWYRMEDIRDSGRRLNEAKQYVTEEAVKGGGLFEAGSFILATTATIGEHAVLIVDSLANQQFTNLKIRKSLSKEVDNEFFFYFLFVIDDYCKSTTKTATFAAVNIDDLKNFEVAIPPFDEQLKIVSYINKVIQTYDTVISTHERRIALLEELKQSVITEAVTHGINPDAKLRPSGIDWIGEIPSHWECKQFRYAIKHITTGLNPRNNFVLGEGNNYYVTIRNFENGKLNLDSECDNINDEALEIIHKRSDLKKGDILFASISEEGKAYVLRENPSNWDINESVFSIRPNKELNSDFLFYVLTDNSFYKPLRIGATGTTFLSIKQEQLKGALIAIPPIDEQQLIVEYIDRKIKPIDASIAKAKREIELLKELKQSVITEAVTGKIKVC